MEILDKFGFDPVMLAAQIVNFIIILYLLKRFLYKPILEVIKKRQENIEEGVRQTEEAQRRLEEAIEKETKILLKAKTQAQGLIDDAKKNSLDLAKQIEANARADTERLIEEARSHISLETQAAEKKLSELTSVLAKNLLEKALQGEIDKASQRKILKNTINKINKK